MAKYKLYCLDDDRTMEFELEPKQFLELKRFLKELKEPVKVDFKMVLDSYNRICGSVGMRSATKLTDKRRRAIQTALKKGFDLESIFRKAAASPFLQGNNDRKWVASFDWIIQPNNLLKVEEGQFDPAKPAAGSSPARYEGNGW